MSSNSSNSSGRRLPKQKTLQIAQSNIPELCEGGFSCGCDRNCSFLFSTFKGNIDQKQRMGQTEFKSYMMATMRKAMVRRESGERVIGTLKLFETEICEEAFRRVWALPRSSYQRYKALILDGKGELPATSAFPVAKAVVTKISYHEEVFRDWADTNMLKGAPQRMPVSGARQIPPIDYGVQYDLYRLDTEVQWAVCAETFKIYVKNLLKARHITVRAKVEVSGICTTCDDLGAEKAQLLGQQGRDPVRWKAYTARFEQRDYIHRMQRTCYDLRRKEGSDPDGRIDSIAADGAANQNTVVPHAPHQVKGISEKKQHFFNLHLQLTILHGSLLLFSVGLPWCGAKGANMLLTTLWNLLHYTAQGRAGKRYFRKELHLQLDGGSENWNKNAFAFCAVLAHYNIYTVIVFHRLMMVAHTHNDCDGWFGLIKMFIFQGYSGKVRRTHLMHFEKDADGVTRLKYKFGEQYANHMPAGVDEDLRKGIEVMKNYPAFDSSPTLEEAPLDLKELYENAWHKKPVQEEVPERTMPEQFEVISDGRNVLSKDLPRKPPQEIVRKCVEKARDVESVDFWYTVAECKAALHHLGVELPERPLKGPLAKALFEATDVARKAHHEHLRVLRKRTPATTGEETGEEASPGTEQAQPARTSEAGGAARAAPTHGAVIATTQARREGAAARGPQTNEAMPTRAQAPAARGPRAGALITDSFAPDDDCFFEDANQIAEQVENAHPPEAATGQFAGVSMDSDDEDDEDDSDDPDDDIPLAYRNLPTDYTIDMLAKSAGKSFAVTVAAGNDGCSFTIRMPGNNAVSMPMHAFRGGLGGGSEHEQSEVGVLASMCASAYADNEENKQNLL
ncbi:hypothetical protein CYMTET_19716 [Cymbomonas tetramitiformis]|uniref:DUF7869 domain-containing protein n=1 Tax=Cymbomonas tetramitiformis TaxID=36881 RepID=A0AAE0G6S4_9CHLO|nr:hypothetical protein CYMTET_19716 [Cymbomonas tetramitiformis]